MKFTAKYEIVELLSSGLVSTFLARDRATQQQFVVHSFDCPGTFSADAQQRAIFQRFASLAPSPAARILEAGIDEGSASAYIVTTLPTAAALQNWIRSYRAFAEGKAAGTPISDENATAELSASEVKAILTSNRAPQSQPPTPDFKPDAVAKASSSEQPASAPVQPKGEFTRLFEDLGVFQRFSDTGAHAKSEPEVPSNSIPTGQFEIPSISPGPPPATTKSSGAGPGSLTQEFFLGKKEPRQKELEQKQKDSSGTTDLGTAPCYPTEPAVKQPGAFTREFLATKGKSQPMGGTDPGRIPSRKEPPVKASEPASMFGGPSDPRSSAPEGPSTKFDWSASEAPKSSPGEFTSFFGGPFGQAGSPKKLDTIPDLADSGPIRQPTGEFTKIFGNESRESSKFPEPQPLAPKTPGSFTQLFGNDSERGARLGVSRLDTDPGQSSVRSSKEPAAPPFPAPAAGESVFSSSPPTTSGLPKTTPLPARGDGTLLHRASPADATDVFRVPGADTAPVPEAPSGPSEFTVFLSRSQVSAALPPEPVTVPPAPSAAPPITAPPVPQAAFPPAPSVAAPPVPQFGMPAAPKPPAPPAVPQATSYWPLITVFTILFAVAAMLVMYFAFKR